MRRPLTSAFLLAGLVAPGVLAPAAGARTAGDPPPARAAARPCLPAHGLLVALTIRRDLLPAVIVRRTSIVAPTYGDPVRDARYRPLFHRALRKLLAGVLPRTLGPASRDPNFATPRSVFASAAS